VKIRLAVSAALIAWCVGSPVSALDLEQERAQFDAKVLKELQAVSPRAAELFAQANQAREKEDHARARDLYAQVAALVPGSPHAVRREAIEEMILQHRDRSIELARAAVELAPSAEDLSSLALVLATSPGEGEIPEADRKEALDVARRAADLEPGNYYVQVSLAQAAMLNQDIDALDGAAGRMAALAPEEPAGFYFQAIAQASQGELGKAERRRRADADPGDR